jgi:hypothetical protein
VHRHRLLPSIDKRRVGTLSSGQAMKRALCNCSANGYGVALEAVTLVSSDSDLVTAGGRFAFGTIDGVGGANSIAIAKRPKSASWMLCEKPIRLTTRKIA